MKRFGKVFDKDEGDTVANCRNAAKTSMVGSGHSSLRSTDQKRRTRTKMNKRTRLALKTEVINKLNEE